MAKSMLLHKKLLFGALLSCVTVVAYATLICKIDNTPIVFTGESKLGNNGTLLWEHKCVQGHIYWLDSVVNP